MRDLSRRAFLERAGTLGAGALALTQAGQRVRAESTTRPAAATTTAPASERIRLGFIGTGGMGRGLLGEFLRQPDADIAAIADVYDPHAALAVQMAEQQGHRPERCRDFRKLLDRRDIDAVVIATPDHWHAHAALWALAAGKDVYVEKPLSYCIAEGRAMVDAARRHRRITQMGIQIHATENYRRVVEIVRSGLLGPIGKVRIWIACNSTPGLGRPADAPAPADLDYDLWLGPAPLRPFNPLRFTFNWRWFWDYAGGRVADMACHIADLVYWALDLQHPTSVVATGGRYVLDDLCETPDTMEAVWEFPPDKQRDRPLQLVWSLSESNGRGIEGRGLGIAFYGTQATLIANYEGYELIAEGERLQGQDKPAPSIPPSPGHHREFLDAIKSRQLCSCDIAYGHRLTQLPHLANIALRVGRRLNWDGPREQFINDAEANRLRSRVYRPGWELPV